MQIIVALLTIVTIVTTAVCVLVYLDRRIRRKYELDTEEKVTAAIDAYRAQTPTYTAPNIWLDYELADAAAQDGAQQ